MRGDVKITLETVEDVNGFKKYELLFLFNNFTSKVEHYHYETFKYTVDMWSMKTVDLMTVVTGQDGEVDALQLENKMKSMSLLRKKSQGTRRLWSGLCPVQDVKI